MSAIINPVPSLSPTPAPAHGSPKLVQSPAPPEKGRSYKRWGALAAIVLALGAWYASTKQARTKPETVVVIPTVKAQKGSIDQVVRVAGQTAARLYANISAPRIMGPEGNRPMVLLSLAPSGVHIKKGTLIASIDGQGLQDHIDDLSDTVEAAEADVRKREAELQLDMETLRQNLLSAKAEADKAKIEASASEVRTEVERQLLTLSVDETAARYKQLESDIDNKKKSNAANLAILNFTLERHKRHIGKHKVDIEKFSIRASIDGLLVYSSVWGGSSMRQIEVGDQITPGQPFMKIVNTNTMVVEAKINQSESEQFRIGQPANVILDAFSSKNFQAKVYSITPLAVGSYRTNYFIRNIPLRIQINGSDAQLIPDLSAAADIVLGRQADKVVVPLASVKTENGKTLVGVKTATGFENRVVELGMRNNTHVAVLSGIADGQEIRASF